jgi:hypothetical protein
MQVSHARFLFKTILLTRHASGRDWIVDGREVWQKTSPDELPET